MPKKRNNSAEMLSELSEAVQRMFINIAPPKLSAENIAGELEALPRRKETWLVVTHAVRVDDENVLLSLVLSPDSPMPVIFQPLENAEELLRFVIESMGQGEGGAWQPYVPERLLVNDTQLAFSWGNLLREAGIRVDIGVPPELDQMVQQAAQMLRQAAEGGAAQALPFLSSADPQEAAAFLSAFDGFMKAKPWYWLDDRPLYAQWQDPQGQTHSLYAVVMGHNQEEFGLSLFERWTDYLEVALARSGAQAMTAVMAQGGREAVNLARTGEELHDDDWNYLRHHQLTRKQRKTWSGGVQQRIGLQGSLPVRVPLPMLTALLEVLADNAPGNNAPIGRDYLTSFKRKKGNLRVSYPATARDELSPEQTPAWIRLRLKVPDRRLPRQPRAPTAKLLTLEIVAPGDTLLGKALSSKLFGQLWQSKLGVSQWPPMERSTLSYALPDQLYRIVSLGNSQEKVCFYNRNGVSPTLSQVLRMAQQEGVYVGNFFNDDNELVSLEIEAVEQPLANATAEAGNIQMRWLE